MTKTPAAALDKTREDPRGTAARILDAAEEVFAEHGYSGASTREIGRRAGVPFGTVHYHWGSKRLLWQAVCQRLVERTRDTVARNFALGGSVGRILDRMTDAFVDLLVSNRNHTRLVCRTFLEDPRDPHVWKMVEDLTQFGLGLFSELAPEARIDARVAIFIISNAFVAALADEVGQEQILGGTVFESRSARERLRKGLRRLARAAFGVRR